MNRLLYFLLALKASMFSSGGFGNVPSMHDDLLARGWATERSFAEAMAVGQVSPGPNGLWVISLGYLVDGLPGALLSAAAISLPPLFVIAVQWLYEKTRRHAAVEGFVRGLGIATVGIFAVVLQRLLQGVGVNAATLLICGASVAVGATKRVPVAAMLSAAALIGLALFR